MDKQWFVLHTLTGKENKARESILARIGLERMEDYIGACHVPTEKVAEKKNGKKRFIERKVFPGYILCELALYDMSKGLDENGRKPIFARTWQFVRETPGVIGFVGVDSRVELPQPIPLKQDEVDAILSSGPAGAPKVARPKIDFSVGETVKITDGAFMGLAGQISMVDPDKGKLKVEVNIFNRTVQVDAEHWQVEKVSVEETIDAPKM
jgi:transcriptional antiterminator NusG